MSKIDQERVPVHVPWPMRGEGSLHVPDATPVEASMVPLKDVPSDELPDGEKVVALLVVN